MSEFNPFQLVFRPSRLIIPWPVAKELSRGRGKSAKRIKRFLHLLDRNARRERDRHDIARGPRLTPRRAR